uniref:Uncharacterized protein n=1 Tax=Anguilla anguilla TaxID=7936 RepID=A0A0E9W259_ANGAN
MRKRVSLVHACFWLWKDPAPVCARTCVCVCVCERTPSVLTPLFLLLRDAQLPLP